MLWFVIIVLIITIAIIVVLINKKITKKPTLSDKDAYGASFGDCSLDLEELRKRSEEKKNKPQ
ncbi:hypothetical protein [Desulfurella sp.]|uniref:hypothetical protein n=1 Tax=Desulfurella sp. TaxID=1962857 RepID=UPI003D102A16